METLEGDLVRAPVGLQVWVSGRRLDELRAYSDLIDEHLRELPFLVQGRDGVIRDHAYTGEHEKREREARDEGRLPIFSL